MSVKEIEEEIRSIQTVLAINTFRQNDVILNILIDRLNVLVEQHHELAHGASHVCWGTMLQFA